MKVTKHGFTYTDAESQEIKICPECHFTMKYDCSRDNERIMLKSIKWDRHYRKFKCEGCGCEGEEYAGWDNLRFRQGFIPIIVTTIISTIVQLLLWYWLHWYDNKYDPEYDDDALTGIATLIAIASAITIGFIAKFVRDFKEDEIFEIFDR